MGALNTGFGFIKALGVELAILAFCGGVLLEVGQTKGPVFDSIGPDVIPQTLAVLVMLLLAVQIAINLRELVRGDVAAHTEGRPDGAKKHWLLVGLFILSTITFLLGMRFWLAPVVVLTPLFVLASTLIFARNLRRRTIMTGASVGVGLGLLQYVVFKNFIHVDLFISPI